MSNKKDQTFAPRSHKMTNNASIADWLPSLAQKTSRLWGLPRAEIGNWTAGGFGKRHTTTRRNLIGKFQCFKDLEDRIWTVRTKTRKVFAHKNTVAEAILSLGVVNVSVHFQRRKSSKFYKSFVWEFTCQSPMPDREKDVIIPPKITTNARLRRHRKHLNRTELDGASTASWQIVRRASH